MLTRQSGTKCNGYVTQCKALLLWKNALHVCFLWFLLRINLKDVRAHGWIQSSSSDLQKSLKFFPNLISQLYVAVHEINYPSCFMVYYETKQRINYSVDHTANPAPPERIRRVSVRAVSSFVDTSENNPKKIRRHDRRKFLPSGWGLDVHGSFHKSLKTHFDWSESLALSCELLKLGYDWLFRSWTTMQTTDIHI